MQTQNRAQNRDTENIVLEIDERNEACLDSFCMYGGAAFVVIIVVSLCIKFLS
jgi:hypothetical protein